MLGVHTYFIYIFCFTSPCIASYKEDAICATKLAPCWHCLGPRGHALSLPFEVHYIRSIKRVMLHSPMKVRGRQRPDLAILAAF